MTSKERQAKREKYIRRYVRAKGLSPKEADKARKLSDENILRDYGIKLPKRKTRIPPVKQPSKKQVQRYNLQLNRFKKAVELGWDPYIAAKRMKYIPESRIKAPGGVIDSGYATDPWRIGYGKSKLDPVTKEDRWRDWSTKKNYPEEIKTLAQMVNKMQGFDEHAGYGYAVVWHAYIENGEVLEFMELLKPDLQEPDRYRDPRTMMR